MKKIFIPDLFDGFILRVVALAAREIRKRGLKAESEEELGGMLRDPPGCIFIFEGPDEKEIVKIFRERIKEVKKAGKATRKEES